MARQVRRISDLPEATELTGDELLEIVQGGENHRVRVDDLPSGGGEANTGANLGGGEGVYASKSGTALQFKSLVAGTNVTLTSSGTDITISAAGGGGGSGTVTSVALSAPTGFDVSGSPVTDSGTLALSFAAGYSLPSDADQAEWSAAFGWGNHESAGYEKQLTAGSNITIDRTDPDNPVISSTAAGGGGGDVVGPASATDSAVALFDGTSGKLLKAGAALGSAAFTASTDYATAAQGALADSAVQSADLADVATSGAYADLSGLPALGTAAAQDSSAFDPSGAAAAAQAYAIQRANHTGTQPISTVSGLGTALEGKVDSDEWYLGTDKQHTANATGSVALDLASASTFDLTLTGNVTLSVSNATVPAGYTRSIVVRVRQGAAASTVTWWSGITWLASATPAAPSANKTKEYVLSFDGTSWLGREGASN